MHTFLKNIRQFLRISLTNFLWRNLDNTKSPSLRIPSRKFVKNLHTISKEMDDNPTRNFLSNYTELITSTIERLDNNCIGIAYEITSNI